MKLYLETSWPMHDYLDENEEFEGQRKRLFEKVSQLSEDEQTTIYNELAPRVKETMRLLQEHPLLAQKELAAKLGISLKTLKVYLEQLRDAYRVEKTNELHSVPFPPNFPSKKA